MTSDRRLFTSYMEYDGRHVVCGSNLKGKVVGKGNVSHNSLAISNNEHVNNFTLISVSQLCNDNCSIKAYNTISRNGIYTCKLGDKSKLEICLATTVEYSTLWHMRLGHVSMRLIQNIASKELVRKLTKL